MMDTHDPPVMVHLLKVYYSIENNGDGSAGLVWFRTKEGAEKHQNGLVNGDGWGEPCWGSVETYMGSDIWREAHLDYAAYVKDRDSWMGE